jgi:hypothetical protein
MLGFRQRAENVSSLMDNWLRVFPSARICLRAASGLACGIGADK